MRSVFGNSTRLIAIGLIVALALFFVFQWSPRLTTGESLSETNGPLPATLQAPPSLSALQTRLATCEEMWGACQANLPKEEPKPILKRAVVISANENPFYSFFAPMVTWTWKNRIGLDVIVIMTRNVPDMIVEATKKVGGIPILMDITWPTGTGKMMQNVRTIAAALREYIDEDTILTTADADMFPLNKTYYAVAEDMRNQLYVHGNHPGTLHMNQYPLCYLSMTVKHWREIMDLKNLTLNEALVRMYIDHSQALADIYFDQDYFYRRVQAYRKTHPEFNVTLVPWDNGMRLDFRVWRDFNFDSQPSWLDSPALRPGFTKNNWPRFKEGLLRHIFDKDTLDFFEKFKDDYVRDVMKGDDEAKGLLDGFGRDSKRFLEEEAYLNRPIY